MLNCEDVWIQMEIINLQTLNDLTS